MVDTPDLTKLTSPRDLSKSDRLAVFLRFFRRLAVHRNVAELYASAEYALESVPEQDKARWRDEHSSGLNRWAQELLENAWAACQEPEGGKCPVIDEYADTSTRGLPTLPPPDTVSRILNTVLLLHVTTSKQYSAHTRSLLKDLGSVDEAAIVATLKRPAQAVQETERHAQAATDAHAQRTATLRTVGVGLGAVAGGVLVGVTGGLAAPLVGAGVSAVLGWAGLGGTAAGLLASGLAGSSVVCGALFGAYGARSTAGMVARHTREVRDLAVVPVRARGPDGGETLAVRLCVSGWLSSREDVTAPWTVLEGDDTVALQWEVEALEALSNALSALLRNQAVKYVQAQIVRQTVLASLMASLSPIAWLKIGKIIDNPWMNARALALKAGAVLGTLLSERAFGNRPVTLIGYSLGSLVILEATRHLATLPPSRTTHLIEDVFLFGTPASAGAATWAAARRVVCGRLVNGYSGNDYLLAVLSRASSASWDVAGLHAVSVHGVENVDCSEDVEGHLKWRGVIGKCLLKCGAPGMSEERVRRQLDEVAQPIEMEMEKARDCNGPVEDQAAEPAAGA